MVLQWKDNDTDCCIDTNEKQWISQLKKWFRIIVMSHKNISFTERKANYENIVSNSRI